MERVVIIQVALAFFIVSGVVFAQIDGGKYDNPDTPNIRASFTIVPNTNDIKELRKFILHNQNNWWIQMMNRFKDSEDTEIFLRERSQAAMEAAEKILAIIHEQEREENTNLENEETRKNFIFNPISEDNDTLFALKTLILSYDMLSHQDGTQELLNKYERFIEILERDPNRKDLGVHARLLWYNANSSFACSLPDDHQRLTYFNKTFDNLKKYLATNTDNPILKYRVTDIFTTQINCAEAIESLSGTSVKKGTLVIPVLEYFDAIYSFWDGDFAKQDRIGRNWPERYEREMTKYRVLAADEPLVVFRELVEEFKKLLESELNENSVQKIKEFHAITEDMASRNEAAQLLYKTVLPIFENANIPAIKDYALTIDTTLNQLALEGQEFEFEAVLLDGTKIDLNDYRGRVVLLNYWRTDNPLTNGLPFLVGLNSNKIYQDKGFEIITFSVDEDVNQTKLFFNEYKLQWPNASEVLSKELNLADSREKYKIKSFPTMILIDKSGKVVRSDTDSRNLETFVKEIHKLFEADN